MWRCLASAIALQILAIALQGADPQLAAQAQDKLPCDAFVKLGDGTWQALTTTFVPDRNFKIQEGSVWRPGATVLGMDVATTLNQMCPNAPMASPGGVASPAAAATPGTSGQPQIPQAPQVPLARYADANGNVDVRSLTCGHLDGTSTEEADLLLAWYSGWYSAQAKKRGINPAQVRYAIRSVADYCKANRDKSLAQVMELMLR
jgi:HdeA/HdeB family